MTVPNPVICQQRGCKFFIGFLGDGITPVCLAFPNGIPEDILSGKNLHTDNINNDGGYKYINKDLIILKGGAGSGHHGHKGRPGEVGGSLPKGASAAKKVREVKFLNADEVPEEHKNQIRQELEEYADELGFPRDKMVYFNYKGSAFIVGENNYETAMSYQPKTGEITVFSNSLTYDENGIPHINKRLIAHEVMHHRFHLFEKQLHRQEALLKKLQDPWDSDSVVLDKQGNVRPEFISQYWAIDIKQRYYGYTELRSLLYQIPVTNYGKSYIEVARTANYGLAVSNAIGENLAEVAAYNGDPNVFISKRWTNLYNEINQGLYEHKLIPKYVPLSRSKG
ncbi:MAG: hypothetical protein WC479_00845 [Candidatus Izemoplasmatales bacterium]